MILFVDMLTLYCHSGLHMLQGKRRISKAWQWTSWFVNILKWCRVHCVTQATTDGKNNEQGGVQTTNYLLQAKEGLCIILNIKNTQKKTYW